LEYVYRNVAKELLGLEISISDALEFKQGRNADVREFTLPADPARGVPRPIRFAAVYGFRNIQNLIRKIKAKRCVYDYVEVMACPSGCNNGGGQGKPPPGVDPREVLEKVEAKYAEAPRWDFGEMRESVGKVYEGAIKAEPGSEAAKRFEQTSFVVREQSAAAALNW